MPKSASTSTQELVSLLAQGPQSAHTPQLNALLAQALEQQLAQILWQIVPSIVADEVRRYVQAQARTDRPLPHETGVVPPPPPPVSHSAPGS